MVAAIRVCYISMLCEQGSREHSVTAASADGASDGQWLISRLAEAGLSVGVHVDVVSIAAGDALPRPDAYDIFILGGTFHGVNDGRSWQILLKEWLLLQRATARPLLGICGGHQAMCVVTGGEVTRRPTGAALGTLNIRQTEAGTRHVLFQGITNASFHFGNSDEVSAVPVGATVLASTADSSAVAIDYGGGWCSVQFHPEATHSIFQHWSDAGIVGPPPLDAPYRPVSSGAELLSNFICGATNHQAKRAPCGEHNF